MIWRRWVTEMPPSLRHNLAQLTCSVVGSTTHANASAAKRLRSNRILDNFRVADKPGTISPCELGARCLTATICKTCTSSPGGREHQNFGPIGPPCGSIIRAWHSRGMASKNLEMNRIFALSSTPSPRWHGPLVQTAPQTSSISAGWTIRAYLQSKLWARDGRMRFIQTTCHEFWKHSGKL